jgi:hypothetical protein
MVGKRNESLKEAKEEYDEDEDDEEKKEMLFLSFSQGHQFMRL